MQQSVTDFASSTPLTGLQEAVTCFLYMASGTGQDRRTDDMNSEPEKEIEVLLSRREDASFVDSLLALPGQVSADKRPNEWDRAINSRLEAALAKQLRSLIDKGERSAA